MPRAATSTGIAFACACALALPLAAQGGDVLRLRDGSTRRGVDVTAAQATRLTLHTADGDTTLPCAQLAELGWGGLDDALQQAFAALAVGDHPTAAALFAAARPTRAPLAADVALLAILCRLRAEPSDRTVASTCAAALRDWLREHPDHLRTPQAWQQLARCERLRGDLGAATAAVLQLDRLGDDAAVQPWRVRGQLELAAAALAAGDATAANAAATVAGALLRALPDAAGAADERADLDVQVRVHAGEAALARGEFAAAHAAFRALVADAQPALRAAGLCGDGQVTLREAELAHDRAQLRQAQLLLARAAVQDPLTGDTAAKCAVLLARAVRALGADGEGDGFRARSDGYLRPVLRQQPDSRWAAAAHQELQR